MHAVAHGDAHRFAVGPAGRNPSREILDIIDARLAAQDAAAAALARSLEAVHRRTVAALVEALETEGEPVRIALLRAGVESYERILDEAGMAALRERWTEDLAGLVDANEQLLAVQAIPETVRDLDETALRILVDSAAERFWRDRITLPSVAEIAEGLARATSMTTPQALGADLSSRLEISRGGAETLARTELAVFDRQVSAEFAASAGLALFWYTGPEDSLTRPFCGVAVGLVFDSDQIAALDNAQGAGAPLVAGGGYNCRHTFVPVGAVTARSLRRATAADVAAANAAAKG